MTALFVAPDGYGDPTIWRRDSDDDRLPQPILSRTAANARGFEELAALVEGAARVRAEALREAADLLVAECSTVAAPCFCSSAPWLRDRADVLARDEREWREGL